VGEIVAEALKRQGTRYLFGLIGGHVQGVIDWACMKDIRFIQVRHEQAAGYAADAFARLTRQPAVMAVTAGPGFLNAASALRHAQLVRSAVVCLVGGHPMKEDDRRTVQELDTVAAARPLAKRATRCLTNDAVVRQVAEAFRISRSYPPGVTVVEFPSDLDEHFAEPPALDTVSATAEPMPSRPDPSAANRLRDLILKAERPVLIGGEGVYWAQIDGHLVSLLERLRLPACFRRLARGTLPEDHELAVNSGLRSKVIRDADLVILVGMELSWLEHFGEWRTDARFVQVSEDPTEFVNHLPCELEIAANPRGVVEALVEGLQEIEETKLADACERKAAWHQHLKEMSAALQERQRVELSQHVQGARKIHPAVLVSELANSLAPTATIILDSFTCSLYGTDVLKARIPAQILDAGRHAGLGHSVGMAIGAKLARPSSQVVALMGDGAVGVGGMDIETAARYGVAAVFVISNNSTLGPGLEKFAYGRDWRILGPSNSVGYNTLQDVRYDRVFEPFGCHGEHVESLSELRPAVCRAVQAGRPAVVNVLTDSDVMPEIYSSEFAAMAFRHLPPDLVEEPCRNVHFRES
jgi:acetolactate synthase-1/2/3 large subunit